MTRLSPRISVNDLALYMLASDTGRLSIIKRAKYPQTPPLIRYRDVRLVLRAYLADPNRSVNPLEEAERRFSNRSGDAATSPLARDDARASIAVIGAVQRMANQLNTIDFVTAPAEQPKVSLGGVEISAKADLLVHRSARNEEQIGAAIFRMTQDDANSENAITKRREMGLYVAAIMRFHVDQNIAPNSNRNAANRICMSIDVQHGEIFVAPDANTRRMNDLESACRFIAAMWPSIQE